MTLKIWKTHHKQNAFRGTSAMYVALPPNIFSAHSVRPILLSEMATLIHLVNIQDMLC